MEGPNEKSFSAWLSIKTKQNKTKRASCAKLIQGHGTLLFRNENPTLKQRTLWQLYVVRKPCMLACVGWWGRDMAHGIHRFPSLNRVPYLATVCCYSARSDWQILCSMCLSLRARVRILEGFIEDWSSKQTILDVSESAATWLEDLLTAENSRDTRLPLYSNNGHCTGWIQWEWCFVRFCISA